MAETKGYYANNNKCLIYNGLEGQSCPLSLLSYMDLNTYYSSFASLIQSKRPQVELLLQRATRFQKASTIDRR